MYIKKGKIAADSDTDEIFNIDGLTVIPGLIDIHNHGVLCKWFDNANYEDYNRICTELAKNGITSLISTSTSLTYEETKNFIKTGVEAIKRGTQGAEILGLYLEGPYLNISKKGGMKEKNIRPANVEEIKDFIDVSEGYLKIITLAPEIKENFDIIGFLNENRIIPSVGHTDGTAEETEKAIQKGIKHTTHLFNAMRGLSHREPGTVGAVLDSSITAEIICDGFHINERIIRMAYKILGRERMILISDNIPFAGMEDGVYILDGVTNIIKNNTCTLEDGTINGNMKFLFECVKNAVKFGIPFEDAVYSSTLNPAKLIGCDQTKGSIKEGKDADLVIVDDKLDIKFVIKSGKLIKV